MTDPLNIAHYFVDEAGDTTLFNRRGKVIVGDEGVSPSPSKDAPSIAAALGGLDGEEFETARSPQRL